MTRLLFYNDSAVLGGHEFMTIELVNALARTEKYEITALFYHQRFGAGLGPTVRQQRLPFSSSNPFPFIRNLRPGHIAHVRRSIERIDPDIVVVSQGNIEIGLKGLIGGRWAGRRTVSYIPLAYSFREMRGRLAAVRDAIDRLYYRLPHAFIVETEYQAGLLRRYFDGPTFVIPYPIALPDLAREPEPKPPMLRGQFHVGVIGRIYFRHKNQDILPRVAERLEERGESVVFHILGDGPDSSRLRDSVARAKLGGSFQFHGWLDKPSLHAFVVRYLDLVLIPSHYEGIPLVLLESVALGKPVLVSRLDCVEEYLVPERLLIDRRDPDDIANKLSAALHTPNGEDVTRFRNDLLARHTRAAFERLAIDTFSSLERI